MNTVGKILAVTSLWTLGSTVSALETERQLSLDTAGLKSFMVDVGAGSLSIQGKPGATQISVEARISVDGVDEDEAQEWMQDYMDLSLKQVKGKALLCATFSYNRSSDCSTRKKLGSGWFGWNKERKIDLIVTMPAHLALEVDDGSGSMQIKNINAEVFIDDGSGDIDVKNIAANLKIDDGSGNLHITNVDGDLYVDDGSGKLIIDQVTGEVEIDDGSGHIKVTNVAKRVYIEDGSGSVDACHLGGDLTVDDGSGQVNTCDDIQGKVVIK